MARWSNVLYLVTETNAKNDMGDNITTVDKWLCYCNKKSIRQSEFYQAQATGLKPELAFEVRSIEYEKEEKLEFNGSDYNIIRTYDKGEIIELICEGVVNSANA